MDPKKNSSRQWYKDSIRKIAYFALLIIFLILSKHILAQHLLSKQEEASQIINMAGRQRMLSQAITKDGLYISRERSQNEIDFYREELEHFLPLFVEEHLILLDLDNSKLIEHLFEDIEENFEKIVKSSYKILDLLKEEEINYQEILNLTDTIRRNEAPYLQNINFIVGQYEEEAREAIKSILLLDNVLLFLITTLIMVIFLRVMRPLKASFESSLTEIHESSENISNIFNTIASPVILVGENGQLLLSNKEAEAYLLKDDNKDEVMIKDAIKWLDMNIELFLKGLKNGLGPDTIEGRLEDAEGQENYVSLTGICGKYAGQEGILLTMKNFTQQKKAEEKIREIAIKDGLTGLYNRSYLEMVINDEIEKAERYELPISLYILDIDHFKKINDKWGHPVGDTVLQMLADIIKNNSRSADYQFRIGGEEFMVILPHTGIEGAKEAAEKMRLEIEQSLHPLVGKFTASFGVAARRQGETYHQLYQKADAALYKAKESGRNRVEVLENEDLGATSLYWKDAWNSGDEKLDAQHKDIFARSSKLQEEYIVSLPQEEALAYVDDLLESTEEHFAYEEELLEKIGYEHLYNHKNIHEYLIKKIYSMRKELEEGNLDLKLAFNFIFDEVVLGHILEQDIMFFPQINAYKAEKLDME